MLRKRYTQSTKCVYQRNRLGLRIPKKTAAQLVSEGAVTSFSSCAVYMNSLTKEAFIQGKKKEKGRFWKLIIAAEETEGIAAVDDEMYKELSAQCRKANVLAKELDRNRKCES